MSNSPLPNIKAWDKVLYIAGDSVVNVQAFLLAGGILLVFSLLVLQRLSPKSRLLSLRVRPEVALLTITLLLCVIGSEVALRLFLFESFPDMQRLDQLGNNLGYGYDRTLGWFPVPNSEKVFGNFPGISIRHNGKGFRDIEPAFDARPGVLFLGDSFVWGYNVQTKERFTEKLRASHPGWQIYNLGVCGYSTDQEFLLLQKRFQEYHPRIVFLIYCAENDDAGNCANSGGGLYFKPYYSVTSNRLKLNGVPVPRSERVFCVRHPLLSKPYLVRLAIRAYANLRWRSRPLQPSPTDAILEAMNQFLSSHGSIFCVGLTRSDPEIQRTLERSNIPCLDLTTELRLENDIHWSPEGHTFVAKKIENFLAGLFPGSSP